MASSPASPMLTLITSASTVGRVSRPRSLVSTLGVGNCTDPAISYRKPSISSTVAAMPPT
jgi:hypothetical protein